jgi:hypothetical protein
MSSIPAHEAISIASSLFAGMLMLKISLAKRRIRWKIPSRCPSCGRSRPANGRCDNCS